MEKPLEQAIRDALALLDEHGFESYPQRHALKAALEQPAQDEPALYQFQDRDGYWCDFATKKHYEATVADGSWPIRALYTRLQAREWVGLTDEEISDVLGSDIHDEPCGELEFIRAIEAKLKERNA